MIIKKNIGGGVPSFGKPATDSVYHRPIVALGLSGRQTGRLLADCMPLICQGRNIYCLDGGSIFDPCRLAGLARTVGLDPGSVLDRVFISRAYTCHQLAEATDMLLAPLAELNRDKTLLDLLVIVLGIDRLFLDEDIALHERCHLYRRVLQRITWISRRIPFLVTFMGDPESCWVRDLARTARLLSEEEFRLPEILSMTMNFQQVDEWKGE